MVSKPLKFITPKESRLIVNSAPQTNCMKDIIDVINNIPGVCVADLSSDKIGITTTKQVHQALSLCLN